MAAPATARPHRVPGLGGMGPFLFAAAAMFTAMYSTQAILPSIGREFDVSPSQTGLTVAPSFGVLLALRVAQGLCMPGLLTVGVPYVTEAFTERIGTRAMGLYVSSLVAGGLVGRVGVALLTALIGWRGALALVAALPLGATLVMRRS